MIPARIITAKWLPKAKGLKACFFHSWWFLCHAWQSPFLCQDFAHIRRIHDQASAASTEIWQPSISYLSRLHSRRLSAFRIPSWVLVCGLEAWVSRGSRPQGSQSQTGTQQWLWSFDSCERWERIFSQESSGSEISRQLDFLTAFVARLPCQWSRSWSVILDLTANGRQVQNRRPARKWNRWRDSAWMMSHALTVQTWICQLCVVAAQEFSTSNIKMCLQAALLCTNLSSFEWACVCECEQTGYLGYCLAELWQLVLSWVVCWFADMTGR